jgi:O-antigen/teichoic acid export membrane protein
VSEPTDDRHQVGVARGTFLGLRADVATAISLVITSIVVARALGPEDRGIFFLGSLVTTYITVIGDLGLSTATMVFATNGRVRVGQLQGVAVLFSLVAGVAGALVLLPFEQFWTDTVLKGLDTPILVLVCVGIPLTVYGQITGALLTGLGRIPVTATARIVVALAYPALLTPVAIATESPFWSLFIWIVSLGGFALGLGLYTVAEVSRPAWPTARSVRQVLSFGLRGYLGTLSYHGFLRIDVFFLSARYGPTLVGIYSLASVVAERISLLGQAVYAAAAKSIGSGSREQAAELTATVLRALVVVMVPAAAVLAAASWPVFPIVFGEDFADASLPFTLLLPGAVCLTLWAVTGLFIVASLQRPGLTTSIQAVALVISLPLYYLAVREAEMTGAAIVSSAVYASVLTAGLVVLMRNSAVGVRDLIPGRADIGGMTHALRNAIGRGARA